MYYDKRVRQLYLHIEDEGKTSSLLTFIYGQYFDDNFCQGGNRHAQRE